MEYDASDKNSVYNFAKKLTGKTLRDVLSPQIIQEVVEFSFVKYQVKVPTLLSIMLLFGREATALQV